MSAPTLPPPIDISAEAKRGVIDGLKKVMATFQEKGFLGPEVAYTDLIHDPQILYDFIQTYRAHSDAVQDLVVGPDKKPVTGEDQPLLCGVTLEQIQQLLVKTCAKYHFDQDKTEEVVTETVVKKSFLFFKKTEQVEHVRTTGGGDDRKTREILKFLAFDWQLPLLHTYREALNIQQILELDNDFLALTSEESIWALSKFEAATLKKVRATAGSDFTNIILNRPQAIEGVSVWNREMYQFYRKILGDKAWEFFSREKAFYNVVAGLDKATASVCGDVLCYIAPENLEEMQRLNIDKTGILVEALKGALGDKGCQAVLSVPSFSKDILRKVVESLLHMQQEKDQLAMSAQLTVKAMAPQIKEWLVKQRANAAASTA